LARLEREHDNLRAALRCYAAVGEPELALRLASALWRFWIVRGHVHEGSRWLDGALAAGRAAAPALRARALRGLGMLVLRQSDHGRARVCLEEALALQHAVGDRGGIAWALFGLGHTATMAGEHARPGAA
jgi:hypothetical protein